MITTPRFAGPTVPLISVTLTTLAFLLLVSGLDQSLDPFIRNDDFPAYLGRADLYYEKTLQEGRWINYWWHLRPLLAPAWLNYALFLLGSAIFAAALSLHALGTRRLWLVALSAAFVAISPQAILISGWFNTLIPGIWITAAYAVLALYLGPAAGRLLMLAFVPVALAAYSTYPLLILLVCLVRSDTIRSTADYLKTMGTFAAAFALGMLAIYGLNWAAHGIFGLSYSNWRSATPAHNLAGLVANFPLLFEFYSWTLSGLGFGRTWLGILNVALFIGALAIIARRSPGQAFYILTGALTGIALLSVLALKDGVYVFFRSTQFAWAAYGMALTRAFTILDENESPRARSVGIGMVALTAVTGFLAAQVYASLVPFQKETRRIAADIAPESTEIRIYGHYSNMPQAITANVQDESGLRLRIQDLTGLDTVYCVKSPELCADAQPPFDPLATEPETLSLTRDGISYIQLPGPE